MNSNHSQEKGRALTIAIDGPAASGKSTLAQALAEDLGYLYFDTGIMYRAVTLAGLQRGLDLGDEQQMAELAHALPIDVRPPSLSDGRLYDLIMDGEDCTWQIRTPEVDAQVSMVSAYAGVRQALSAAQRRIGLRGEVVMVGRDIGTVVLPEADLKIYLDASVEERARRRFEERSQLGDKTPYEKVEHSLRERDRIDANRAVAPLRPADDAVILNSDEMDAAQVLEETTRLVQAAQERVQKGE
jgi:cytidylate kinase